MNDEALELALPRDESLSVYPGRLEGTVRISGAKNAVLRHLAAALLTDEAVTLTNFPSDLLDVKIQIGMLQKLGKHIELSEQTERVTLSSPPLQNELDWPGKSIRNTLLVLGTLLARTGYASVPLPGGCDLGGRGFDLHIELLRAFGAEVWQSATHLFARSQNRLVGADVKLRVKSTGATENAILVATLARGLTTITNPHIRPEILDLLELLRKMGAIVEEVSREKIQIRGVDALGGATHRVPPDNMEAITWAVGAGVTGGQIEIVDFPAADLSVALTHLEDSGLEVFRGPSSAIIRGRDCQPIEISTGPHPGINSDVQPIFAAWAAAAKGLSRLVDLRFPGRFQYRDEMHKMGVTTSLSGDGLTIFGTSGALRGADVRATDLRAGAALLLCAIRADGPSLIRDAWQLRRGYSQLVPKLNRLGVQASLSR